MATEALDAYLDFLDSSTTNTDKEAQPTPHIDTILNNYRQRSLHSDKENSEPSGAGVGYEGRLFQLEKQLTGLLQRSKAGSPLKQSRRSSNSENSESHENSPPLPLQSSSLRHSQTSGTRRRHLQTANGRSTQNRHAPSKRPLMSVRERDQRSKRAVPVKEGGRRPTAVVVSSAGDDERTRNRLVMESRKQQETAASLKVLSEDLDKEKERRWKAEEAAGRLVEHVRNLQSQLSDSQRQNDAIQKRCEELERNAKERHTEVEALKSAESKHLEMLHKLEESGRLLEYERQLERSELCSRLHKSETDAAVHQREGEAVRKEAKELKKQVHQLQDLLAKREKDHVKELERLKPLPDHRVDELVRREVGRECSKLELMLEQQKQRLVEKEKAYRDLEDEFRMALKIEASRYQELQTSHQQVVGEVQSCRETAVTAVKKEQRATSLVSELTAMIKEQKSRIGELSRGKQETVATLKERCVALEEAVCCQNKLDVKVKVLQEENSRLSAQVSAQESVIDGLREERQLWGKELAHQGASLAQERGRIEAQLDSLTNENKTLREELARERDRVRIKEKQVEDQLESIHQLKRDLSSREHEVQSQKLDWQREQQSLQLLLGREEASNREMQEELSKLTERKEQLKADVKDVESVAEEWKEKYRKLNGQWEEKMAVLNELEQKMADVQKSFAEKEEELVQERDKAIESARSCEQRLKSYDDAFRQQLEVKQRAHDSQMAKVVAEKDEEIVKANQKVLEVEEEMRALLREMADEKRRTETKLLKLSQAFQELHANDL